MSLLSRTLTASHVVLNVSATVSCLFMSYFWYQNARSVRESRIERLDRSRHYQTFMQTCQDVYQPSCCPVQEGVSIVSESTPVVAITNPSVTSECCSSSS
ncbi:MAG: hypothetical protein PHG66_04425 [Candidatus Colwellbacteria bacterium]|nr:hypothetical protein [Candidatus Colwellbacteria bacterium]